MALGREITVTERMESHLVWGSGRIFCKPIPRYLLNTAFWERHLSCDRCRTTTTPGMINPLPNPPPTSPPSVAEAAAHQVMAGEAGPEEGDDDDSQSCGHRQPRACALGFLLSYVALIVYESDFFIAKEKHLIPNQITWPAWRQLVGEILADDTGPNTTSATPTGADSRTGITIRSTPAGTKNSRGDRNGSANRLYTFVAPRFIYGELRLNRLNLIFVARRGPLSTGFVATWHSFGSFYRDNSAWIITVAAYILLMLSAVQVGLATDRLEGNDAFQAASYGFTVFAMLVPIFSLGVLVFFSAVLWTYHVMRTRQFEAKRAKVLGRAWREEQPGRDGGIRRGSSLPLE